MPPKLLAAEGVSKYWSLLKSSRMPHLKVKLCGPGLICVPCWGWDIIYQDKTHAHNPANNNRIFSTLWNLQGRIACNPQQCTHIKPSPHNLPLRWDILKLNNPILQKHSYCSRAAMSVSMFLSFKILSELLMLLLLNFPKFNCTKKLFFPTVLHYTPPKH